MPVRHAAARATVLLPAAALLLPAAALLLLVALRDAGLRALVVVGVPLVLTAVTFHRWSRAAQARRRVGARLPESRRRRHRSALPRCWRG